jgi:Zn-finger nucleic acid-binding protein
MNVPEAGFCSACGKELGLEPLGEDAALPCPVCKIPLVAFREEIGSLFDCGTCGGQFVEHPLLRSMLKRHEHTATGAALPGGMPDPRSTYVPCPACASLMNRKNFGSVSGVVVDVCKKHGTWFDLGELPWVLAFVAAGGLDVARRRDEEEEARSRRAALAIAASGPTPLSSRDPILRSPTSAHGLAERLFELLLH